jgi:hypothetical protein
MPHPFLVVSVLDVSFGIIRLKLRCASCQMQERKGKHREGIEAHGDKCLMSRGNR